MARAALSLYIQPVLDFELEPLLRSLAAEFRRRGMDAHIGLLRSFYARYRAEKKRSALARKPSWEIDTVLEWLAVLRIPPFDRVYQTLPYEAQCPKCTLRQDPLTAVFTRAAVHGTTVMQCLGCGQRWLVQTALRGEAKS